MTCKDAIAEAFQDVSGVLTTADVVNKIYDAHPDQPWQKTTIQSHLIGLSINHQTSKHYPSLRQNAFLFSLGNGRYRLWDQSRDGNWVIVED